MMKKILIAEDIDSNYILMTYILRNKYDYARATNGQEAIDMVDAGGIDLVLMDIKMPVVDGLKATTIIKERHPEIPVVALTAHAFDSDRKMCMDAGCDAFLSKPINGDLCLETISKFIGK